MEQDKDTDKSKYEHFEDVLRMDARAAYDFYRANKSMLNAATMESFAGDYTTLYEKLGRPQAEGFLKSSLEWLINQCHRDHNNDFLLKGLKIHLEDLRREQKRRKEGE